MQNIIIIEESGVLEIYHYQKKGHDDETKIVHALLQKIVS